MPVSKKRKKIERKPKPLGLQKKPKVEIITLVGNLRDDNPPHIECTCGYKTEPSSRLLELGNLAKKHAIETGHKLREH